MKKKQIQFCAAAMVCSLTFGSMPALAAENKNQTSQLKIGVMSDTHYFSKDLYSDCEDFTTAMNSDRKMFQESEAILDSALDSMVADEPNMVLISGDLTKDGEQINHEAVAKKLEEAKQELAKKGVDTQFYVVNGNHDINNPNGKDYSSGQAVDADRTTVEEFKEIYEDFGYGKDTEQYAPGSNRGGSLSYVAHPADGYTLIAVDSGKYSADQTASGQDLQETGGVISKDLLNWVTQEAKEAKRNGDVVMVMQHHGVVEHFSQEPTIMADYLVDNYQEVQQAYADAGVSYVFTGHMHANDIATYTSPAGNTLYDIETGSLVTYPSPTRQVTVTNEHGKNENSSSIKVDTNLVKEIDYTDPDTQQKITDLTAYGKTKTLSPEVVKTMLTQQLLGPAIDKIQAGGGIKPILASLLGTGNPETVPEDLVKLLFSILPKDKESGLDFSLFTNNYKIYYDETVNQLRISQLPKETTSTESASSNEAVITTPEGKQITFELPEDMIAEFQAQTETQDDVATKAQNELGEIFLTYDKAINLVTTMCNDIDGKLIGNKEAIFTLVDTAVDELLSAKVDESHNVFDLVNYVYQTHLAGAENCESWAETAIAKIQSEGLLNNIIKDVLTTGSKTMASFKKTLAQVPIDLKHSLESNEAGKTFILLIGIGLNDAGDILGYIDLATMIPDDLYSQISGLAYGVAYSMSHDVNYAEDNNTSIVIKRSLADIIAEGENKLAEAEQIQKGDYTQESYNNLQTAISELKNALAAENAEQIQAAIAKVDTAIQGLQTEQPSNGNDGQSGTSNDQQSGQNNKKAPGLAPKTGDTSSVLVWAAVLSLAMAAGGVAVKRKN